MHQVAQHENIPRIHGAIVDVCGVACQTGGCPPVGITYGITYGVHEAELEKAIRQRVLTG